MPATYATPAAARPPRRRSRRSRAPRLLRGLLTAVGVTLACVLLFALLMQWLRPSDTVVRVVNQLIKLASIFVGVWVMSGRGSDRGLMWGALLGLIYMALGVGLYALLSGQQLPFTAYLSDLAMGVAGGGIAGAIPSVYAGFVLPRSGLSIKHGVSLVNAPGLIDSNYRGEIQAILVNLDPQSEFAIKRGDRIAQLVVMRVPDAAFDVCAELPDTEGGAGGFGSSGVSL